MAQQNNFHEGYPTLELVRHTTPGQAPEGDLSQQPERDWGVDAPQVNMINCNLPAARRGLTLYIGCSRKRDRGFP